MVENALDEVLDSLKDGIFDSIATAIQAQDRSLTTSSVNKKARTKVEEAWRARAGRIAIAPGKTVISRMSEWSQHEFGVSFGPRTIAQEMIALEFDPEVISLLSTLERGAASCHLPDHDGNGAMSVMPEAPGVIGVATLEAIRRSPLSLPPPAPNTGIQAMHQQPRAPAARPVGF